MQDDDDSTKQTLVGAKMPVAVQRKDPFILEKHTPKFNKSSTEIHQHVSSQSEALASRYYRYEFNCKMLNYLFCDEMHDHCLVEPGWIKTLVDTDNVHLSGGESELDGFNVICPGNMVQEAQTVHHTG
jgi:hypothetical protein